MLGVHHLDMNPGNSAWWNLVPLCQRCHLQIQHKVILERAWMLEHTPWFRPYAAGWYAHVAGLTEDRDYVLAHVDALLDLGQGRISLDEYIQLQAGERS
jgi:hypothetical protein